MKRIELFFLGALVPLDYAALMLAALSAYALRFGPFRELLPTTVTISFTEYMGSAAIFSVAFLFIFAIAGLYNPRIRRRMAGEFPRIVLASSTGIAIVIVSIFFQREFFASRFIVLAAWGFTILYVLLARTGVRLVWYTLVRAGVGLHRVALVGGTMTADVIAEAYRRERRWASKVVARFTRFDEATKTQLTGMLSHGLLDDVMLTDPTTAREDIIALGEFCDNHHLGFRYTADLLGTERASIETITLAGIPVIVVKRTPLEGWGAIAKRAFDIVGATLLIIVLSPVLITLALAVKLSSRGPIIYKNERVGMEGKRFTLFKFRSMYAHQSIGAALGGEAALKYEQELITKLGAGGSPVYKMPETDPRITPVGRFIRRWSLDELPQLFNVLLGPLSLVGPRPHQPREVAQYQTHHHRVLAIKPGITGLAQISGRRALPFEDEVRLDNFYIEHWSPYLDLIILVKTPLVVFGKKGAY